MIKKIVLILLLLQTSFCIFAKSHHLSHKSIQSDAPSEVYISRENSFVGCLATYKTYIDGNFIGKLGVRGYLKNAIVPGHHKILVETYENKYEKDLIAKPGYAYFLQLGEGINYTGKDAAVTAIGTVVGAKTGVAFFSPGKIVGGLRIIESKKM